MAAAKFISKVEATAKDGTLIVAVGSEVTAEEAKKAGIKPADLVPVEKAAEVFENLASPADSVTERTAKVKTPGVNDDVVQPRTLEEETVAPRRSDDVVGNFIVVKEKIGRRSNGTEFVEFAVGQEVTADEADALGDHVLPLAEGLRQFANRPAPQDNVATRTAKVDRAEVDATVPNDPPTQVEEVVHGSKERAAKADEKPAAPKGDPAAGPKVGEGGSPVAPIKGV